MSFRITVADLDRNKGICRLTVTAGDVQVRSYPQTLADNFRDLHANRILMGQKILSSIFFGDEPILKIDYLGGDLACAYLYKEGINGPEKTSSEFMIRDALSSIDDALIEVDTASPISDDAKSSLLEQVSLDFAVGAYNAYEKT